MQLLNNTWLFYYRVSMLSFHGVKILYLLNASAQNQIKSFIQNVWDFAGKWLLEDSNAEDVVDIGGLRRLKN